MPAPKSLPGFANWKGLLSIGIAYLWSIRDGKETSEVRYFISSLPIKVKQFAHAVRSHWGIGRGVGNGRDFGLLIGRGRCSPRRRGGPIAQNCPARHVEEDAEFVKHQG